MTNPLFFVDHKFAPGETFTLDGDEGRHAATVKRLRVGETVDVANGKGLRASCSVTQTERNSIQLLIIEVLQESVSTPQFTVVQALAKGDRADLALEVLTEVGVDVIVPWSATHCVVKWDEPAKAKRKWQRTITEAAKQSRRAWIPELFDLHSTPAVADLIASNDIAVVLHESANQSIADLDISQSKSILVIVGPEGGITDQELSDFQDAGAQVVRMGSTVMRTSTAGAICLGALLPQTSRWATSEKLENASEKVTD